MMVDPDRLVRLLNLERDLTTTPAPTPREKLAMPRPRWHEDPVVRAVRRRIQGRADCTECGVNVATHVPKGGDGSAEVTYWHKRPDNDRWCRSEVDVEDVQIVDRPAGWGTRDLYPTEGGSGC